MRIYLDNCALNRPFDEQTQIRIKLEIEAKLYIQDKIKEKRIEIVWSYILDIENDANPFIERRNQIIKWKKYSIIDIEENENIIQKAKEIANCKIKAKDSLHISCAISTNCDYFITTDDYILKKSNAIKEIIIISPIMFIEMEANI